MERGAVCTHIWGLIICQMKHAVCNGAVPWVHSGFTLVLAPCTKAVTWTNCNVMAYVNELSIVR